MSTDYGAACKTQRDRLLEFLSDFFWHNHAELFRVAGVRYGARVLELKRLGYEIETRSLNDLGNQYRLRSLERGKPQHKRVKVLLAEKDACSLLLGMVTQEAQSAISDALQSYRTNREKL